VCGALDRVVVEGEPGNRIRRCVECNFRELLAQSSVGESPLPDDSSAAAAIDVVRVVIDSGRDRDLE
jgi:hypothetical protein